MVLWKTESAEFKEKTRAESGGKKKREVSGRSNPPAPTKNPGCENIRDFSLTRKPQAMLVDEKSTSVETVKKNLLLLQ